MTFLEYLNSQGNTHERFDFPDNDSAYNFGTRLRDQIKEQGDSDVISVDISNSVVRVKLIEEKVLS